MNIRLATTVDKEKVLALFDEFSKFQNAKDIPSELGGYIFDEIISRKDTMIFVAEEEGNLYAVVTFYLLPNIRHGWHRGHIEDFFVISSMRGTGLGTRIFNEIKEYCRRNKIKVIKLDSGLELTAAHHFYEKNGGKYTEKMFRFDID
jgi:GNAT superfamily N-acetyltransferase